MGIIGLTDNQPSFPRIGELRKGDVKGANRPGKDLKHFRFTSSIPGVAEKFTAIYDNEPNEIDCFLPYATTASNFEAWQEEWAAGGLVHRCDGQQVVMYQKDGKYIIPEYGSLPCPYAVGKRERTKQNPGCKQAGRLKIVIPALGRLAYVVALTTSINDIMELHANLLAYEALRGDLRGIPFILSRVPRMVSTPTDDGKRARREKWLLHIEAAPEWVQAQLSAMQRHALPSGGRIMLQAGNSDLVEVDTETGEIVESDEPEDGSWESIEAAADASTGKGHDMTPADPAIVATWREKVVKGHRLTARTVASMVANAVPYYDNDYHALAHTDYDGKEQFTDVKPALEMFDGLVAKAASLASGE